MDVNVYTTLYELRRALGLTAAQTGDDDLLLGLLKSASRLIDRYAGRQFHPVRQMHSYAVEHPALLLLRDDLVQLHSLTNGDGTSIPSGAIHLEPAGAPVKSALRLDPAQAVLVHDGDPLDAIQVDGTWGFHPDWARAWQPAGDAVQNNPLAAGATSITVADADAPGPTGYGVRFAAGHLLRLESEYVQVLAVNAAANTLAVARGANGTTAASHAQGTTIERYDPPDDIRQVCLRVAMWLYKQRDAGFVQVAGGLRGQIAVPPALPDDVQQALGPYVRVQVA